jgi:hypothetical protein
MNIKDLASEVNIAEKLSDEELQSIAERCINEFDGDVDSRVEWEEKTEEWVNLATQIVQTKNWPWQGSANVKYPLVAISAMQFAARAYPSLVPATGDQVSVKVIGNDPDGQKAAKAALEQAIAVARVNQEKKARGLTSIQVTLHAVFAYFCPFCCGCG